MKSRSVFHPIVVLATSVILLVVLSTSVMGKDWYSCIQSGCSNVIPCPYSASEYCYLSGCQLYWLNAQQQWVNYCYMNCSTCPSYAFQETNVDNKLGCFVASRWRL